MSLWKNRIFYTCLNSAFLPSKREIEHFVLFSLHRESIYGADKEKIQTLIGKQRRNLAEVDYLDLDSVTKLVQDFENTKKFWWNCISWGLSPKVGILMDECLCRCNSRVDVHLAVKCIAVCLSVRGAEEHGQSLHHAC